MKTATFLNLIFLIFFLLFTGVSTFNICAQDCDDQVNILKNFNFDDLDLGDEDDEEYDDNDEDGFNLLLKQLLNKNGMDFKEDPVSDLDEESLNRKEWWKDKSDNSIQEFNEHISKYFPKVFLIREKFLSRMTPEDIAQSFKELVDMFSEKPWLCVEEVLRKIQRSLGEEERSNWVESEYDLLYLLKIFRDKGFETNDLEKWLKMGGGCWEFIADQLTLYDEFLRLARVDSEDGTVFLEKNSWGGWGDYSSLFGFGGNKNEQTKTEKLKDYWEKIGITVHHDLYAIMFDYWTKLFLEEVLNKDLDQAYRYYDDLRVIMDKFAGTQYESERQEDIKTYRELLDILKRKVQGEKSSECKGGDGYWDEMEEMWDMD